MGAPVVANSLPAEMTTYAVTRQERTRLLLAVLIISICALVYELIVATLSSYLLGDSITQFSFTIGFFLFAMGLGALISRRIHAHELRWFIIVELIIGLSGGLSAVVLFAVFSIADQFYFLAMASFSLVIGICVGLEIPLLTRIVALQEHLSSALADILSVDYIGALVASLVFPTVLLPLLGVTQTAFLMGLLNIAVASMLLVMFRGRLSKRWARRLTWTATLLALIMVAGVVGSTNVVRNIEQRLYEDVIIYDAQTPYQRMIITRGSGDDLRLYLNGNLQFSSRDEYRYHEMLVHPVMSAARSHETVLVLGGGDGLVAREVLKYDDVSEILIVDIDPQMTDFARQHPLMRQVNDNALNDPRVEIINADAYKFVEESPDLYPVVIIDLPDPNNESLSKLYSQQFYQLLRQRLTPDGAFITQAASPYFVREAYWTIANTIAASEFHILPLRAYIPSFGEWGFVLATPYRPPVVQIPENIALRYLTADVLDMAQVFDPDIAPVTTAINTLNNPILPRYYEAGWREWD